MTDLEIILKWREKRLEEKKITENWQIGLLLDCCQYFEKEKKKKETKKRLKELIKNQKL